MAGALRGLVVGALVAGAVAACTPSGPPPPGSAAPTPPLPDRPWPMHTIAGTFRGANGLGAGDVNGDGLTDYVTNYEFDQRYILSIHPVGHRSTGTLAAGPGLAPHGRPTGSVRWGEPRELGAHRRRR